MAFSPSGSLLAASAASGDVRLFDTEAGTPRPPLVGHLAPLGSMAFSPDGRLLATGGYDKQLIVFDAASGQPLRPPIPHSHWILGTAFSPDGALLATTTFDGNLALYDGRTLDVISARLNFEGFHGAASVAFAPNGRQFVTGSGDGTITVWDTASRSSRLTSAVHSAAVTGVAWSPDAATIVTYSTDGTSRIVDAATGRPLGDPFPMPERGTASLSRDGHLLAISDPAGVLLWSLDPVAWRDTACRLAGRNLSTLEWDEHLSFAGGRRKTCDQFDLPA